MDLRVISVTAVQPVSQGGVGNPLAARAAALDQAWVVEETHRGPSARRGGWVWSVTSSSSRSAQLARAAVIPVSEAMGVPLGSPGRCVGGPRPTAAAAAERPFGPGSQGSPRSRSLRWAKNDAVVWKPASRREREEFLARPRGRRVIQYADFG